MSKKKKAKRLAKVLGLWIEALRATHAASTLATWENYIAAAKAMPPELAEKFAGTHLRSARITHLLERPNSSLPGVQHLAGHKQVSTTARYVKPSYRAALDTLGATA